MQGLGEAGTTGLDGVEVSVSEQSEMNDFGSNSNSFWSQIVILGC